MKYPVVMSDDATVALPRTVLEQMGHPAEVEVERVADGLLIRHPLLRLRAATVEERLESIRSFREGLTPDPHFSQELAVLRAEEKLASARKEEQLLRQVAGYDDDDLSP